MTEFDWLDGFDESDKTELVSDIKAALATPGWAELKNVLHEWAESGRAALSPEIREAFVAD